MVRGAVEDERRIPLRISLVAAGEYPNITGTKTYLSGRHAMNEKDGEICVRVLACVAWADGELTEEEMASVVDIVDRLDYVDRSLIQEILMTPARFTFLDKVVNLSRGARVRLLHDCYVLADYCGGVSEQELEIVRAIALTVVDNPKWESAEASLQAWVDYEKKARRVWGWTHLAD